MIEEYSNRYDNTHPTAIEMANMLEDHTLYFNGVSRLTDEGWDQMSAAFGDLLPEIRATVFNDFARELTRRGIEYDVTDFMNRPGETPLSVS